MWQKMKEAVITTQETARVAHTELSKPEAARHPKVMEKVQWIIGNNVADLVAVTGKMSSLKMSVRWGASCWTTGLPRYDKANYGKIANLVFQDDPSFRILDLENLANMDWDDVVSSAL